MFNENCNKQYAAYWCPVLLLWIWCSWVLLQIADILKERLFRALGIAGSNWKLTVIRNYEIFSKDKQVSQHVISVRGRDLAFTLCCWKVYVLPWPWFRQWYFLLSKPLSFNFFEFFFSFHFYKYILADGKLFIVFPIQHKERENVVLTEKTEEIGEEVSELITALVMDPAWQTIISLLRCGQGMDCWPHKLFSPTIACCTFSWGILNHPPLSIMCPEVLDTTVVYLLVWQEQSR